MVRIGVNPARDQKSEYRPAPVTVACVVHIPALVGYHTHRLDILKLCLASILQHTPRPFDLMVLDNGSCAEVGEYLKALHAQGLIKFLISVDENIGKMGAFQILFRAAPGEIIAYSDDDVFHYPGWLEGHLEILNTYPNVGLVSGFPALAGIDHRVTSTLAFAQESPEVFEEEGNLVPEAWQREFALSTGRDPEAWVARSQEVRQKRLTYRGVKAYVTAAHYQFVTRKEIILEALPEEWTGKLMREMWLIDETIDRLGYLRLSTAERTVSHMGNLLDGRWLGEAEKLGIEISTRVTLPSSGRRGLRRLLMRLPGVRWFLQGLYNRLFWILSAPDDDPRR